MDGWMNGVLPALRARAPLLYLSGREASGGGLVWSAKLS